MRSQLLAASVAIGVGLVVGAALPRAVAQGQTASAARYPKNAAEFDEMFNKIKNWGRWGPDDQLGAVNLITDAKRKEAAALVKSGISVSLEHELMTEAALDNGTPIKHILSKGFLTADIPTDTYEMFAHGSANSHFDTFCHVLYKGRAFNGNARESILTDKGCSKDGVENFKNGIVTRAVLIDIPRLKGIPYMEPGTPVFVEDIEAWEKKAGVKVLSGDAILLRTGRWARRQKFGPEDLSKRPGFHSSVAPWMKARGIALMGSDVGQDVMPTLVEGVPMLAVHQLMVASLGVPLLDNQDLEAVAATAARLNRWEFMLTVAPLNVPGGTGSPVNVLAIF